MSEQMQNYVVMLNMQLHVINRYVPFLILPTSQPVQARYNKYVRYFHFGRTY